LCNFNANPARLGWPVSDWPCSFTEKATNGKA
jgi:hypothetical protein